MFLFTSVDRTPMDKAPSRRVTYKASVCNVVLDVHVKQDCSPGKGTFLSEKDKVQHRARVTMPSMGTSATEKKDHHLRYCAVLNVFHHRVTQSSTEFESLLKRR